MNQEKIKELESRIEQIKTEIDELKKQDEKWEPQGGDWAVLSNGEVCLLKMTDHHTAFGARYPTRGLAKIAAREMRKFNRVLAYKLEHCPYTVEGWVVCESNSGWFPAVDPYMQLAVPYMDQPTAHKLANDLNSGRVTM